MKDNEGSYGRIVNQRLRIPVSCSHVSKSSASDNAVVRRSLLSHISEQY